MTFNRSGLESVGIRIGLVLLLCPGVELELRGVKCELLSRVGSGSRTMAEVFCVWKGGEREKEEWRTNEP